MTNALLRAPVGRFLSLLHAPCAWAAVMTGSPSMRMSAKSPCLSAKSGSLSSMERSSPALTSRPMSRLPNPSPVMRDSNVIDDGLLSPISGSTFSM